MKKRSIFACKQKQENKRRFDTLLLCRFLLLAVAIGIMISAPQIASYFAGKEDQEKIDVVFPIEGYDLQITADERYEDVTEDGNFDLQLNMSDIYLSLYAFDRSWLREGQTTKDIYNLQNEDLWKYRTDVEVLEEESTRKIKNGSVTRTLYQAKKMGLQNIYDCYLIEFDVTDTFAWVVVTASPADYKVNGKYLQNVVLSLEPIT